MRATNKAPAIDAVLTQITGKDRLIVLAGEGCMTCNTPDLNFKDELSKKEYTISGMCQTCQNAVFG